MALSPEVFSGYILHDYYQNPNGIEVQQERAKTQQSRGLSIRKCWSDWLARLPLVGLKWLRFYVPSSLSNETWEALERSTIHVRWLSAALANPEGVDI